MFYIFFFFLGAAFASFLNVLVFGENSVRKALKRTRSRCEKCKKVLSWWELVPVISYVALLGKCSKCKKPIPYYHLISEILLGLMFLVTYIAFNSDVFSLYGIQLFVLITYFFSMYDIKKGIVPDRWILPIVGVTLLLTLVRGAYSDDFITFVGQRIITAIGYSLFFVLMNAWSISGLMPGVKKGKQGFGWGDSKYAPFLALVLGPLNTIVSCWVAIFSGAFIGVILLAKYKDRDMRVPYVPFMTIGAWVALVWGDKIAGYFINMWRF